MIRKVLIPLDGSELAAGILPLARRLVVADDPDAELVLLLSVDSQERAKLEEETDRATQYLQGISSQLAGESLKVSTRIVRGDPAEQILAAIDDVHPDLVAMATHGRSGVARLVRGSVAERVLRACPAPLLLSNPEGLREDPSFKRILVPLDGSEVADRILPYVIALGAVFKCEVTLLRVEPFLPYVAVTVPSPALAGGPQWDPDKVAATLEGQKQRLSDAGLQVEIKATLGIEAQEILREAEDADLVAMSTHGRSGISRWWFGSVAEQVLRHCHRPLLVVRAEGAAQ